ncbi:TPA: 50S ribosomal protein L28 [Candidatus Galligastranaerophilus intestinavium]|uniref:Large ribosomal subunit protein bL28 n=1 Tax=Candidatus Galligastranaerophilus intestinavium TaxID=2840836 RepID=A0A9D1FH36_9BACT|nr:50S ribosomal protein L28 [Candidatus Galligastranaerophilus faecipullorum]HIS73409.1 50S ribosomal protein L28 [Candidatus Galligastranaerophilus intestinavium]
MSIVCEICGKKSIKAAKISFSHKQHVHRQLPNLHRVKAVINGVVKRVRVCSSCIRAGKVKKAI